jgi:hypothetical protein
MSVGTKKKRSIIRRSASKHLRPELREFLDACVVPALVEKYFAERKETKK